MPWVGQLSSTNRSFGPGEYAPTEEAYTRAGTPASATAWKTRSEPLTLIRQRRLRSREGWIAQARWTTASAPRKCGASSSTATSAVAHSTFGTCKAGSRRARPRTESTSESRASAPTRLVPTFPVAPTTTTLILRPPDPPGCGPTVAGRPAQLENASCRLHDPQLLAEREERRGIGRAVGSAANVLPVDLLPHGPGHLDDALVVELVLAQSGQLRHEHVLERDHLHRHRVDVQFLRAREDRILDRLSRRPEDQVDHHLTVERLVEPAFRRCLGSQPRGREDSQATLGVRLSQHQVDDVRGLRAAALPDRQTPAQEERPLRVPPQARHLLQCREQLVERRFLGWHGYGVPARACLNRFG